MHPIFIGLEKCSICRTIQRIKRSHESALSLVEPTGKTRVSVGHVTSSEPPLCRPWDRGDLVRRLATFKSMTWFAKPKAQKLVSLCGWEPRALPYVVDCKDRSTQLVKDSDVRDSYHMVINGQNPSIRVHSVASEQSVEANEESGSCSGRHADPNADVLECKLCGARQDSANENHAGSRGVIGDSASNGALSSMHRPSDLSVTIVGGPLPTKQNFKATISLPVIGQNLRARLSYDSDFRDRIWQGQCSYSRGNQSSCLNFESSEGVAFRKENNSQMSSERTDITREPTFPETAGHDSAVQCSTQSPRNTVHVGAFRGNQASTSQVAWSDAIVPVGNGKRSESNSSEMIISSINHHGQQIPGADISGRKDPKQLALDKTLGFNPIRQRRHFCTWIVSTSSGPPGWQQTLSALERQKEFSLPSTNSPPSSSLIKVDDPIASVRKLFMSPIKRTKPTSGSS
ncbi:hypothetical protein POPTR_012G058550v4 [Populus trichocarpa]|uniref:Uncharacterized protein n=1 Tax=Populus trichocarpa TaxID=3694 RepID=A0ACC0S4I6_POPTR|nr:hypothetical protein POPTR_012G058550v4 [Populus trichocarpa]